VTTQDNLSLNRATLCVRKKMRRILTVVCTCAGVWFMHCHLEVHVSWGLKMAWLVLDGDRPNEKLLPPPSDLPKC
jgi:hypothetical protein